jgi:hypothetical protein
VPCRRRQSRSNRPGYASYSGLWRPLRSPRANRGSGRVHSARIRAGRGLSRQKPACGGLIAAPARRKDRAWESPWESPTRFRYRDMPRPAADFQQARDFSASEEAPIRLAKRCTPVRFWSAPLPGPPSLRRFRGSGVVARAPWPGAVSRSLESGACAAGVRPTVTRRPRVAPDPRRGP